MSRLRHWWSHIATMEPARVRAGWTALAAVLVSAGVTITAETDARVTAAIAALAVLLPIIQGELTRAVVVPVARHEAAVEAAEDSVPPVNVINIVTANETGEETADA